MTTKEKDIARDRLDGLTGKDLMFEASRIFGDRLALVSSFGTESAVLLHMASERSSNFPVIFLDTGKLFAHTYDYQSDLIAHLSLTNVRTIRPEAAALEDEDPLGGLWRTHADRCCSVRKVWPLQKALEDFEAWITGRKRFQTGERRQAKTVDVRDDRLVLSPVLNWSKADIDAYFITHGLPRHPLEDLGYPSVGCITCTENVRAGEDVRAGRWRGQAKTECGIHRPALSSAA